MEKNVNPNILYHYTSTQGLIGIITQKNIWATSIFHLNDKEELFHARGMFRDVLDAYKKGVSGKKLLFIEEKIGLFTNYSKDYPIFVCSFSEIPDQLSQWRGYCPNGNGFMIGFNRFQLEQQMKLNKIRLEKCIYDKKKQKAIVNQFVKKNIKSKNLTSLIEEEPLNVVYDILNILPILKNESFVEEKEWRLIASLNHDDIAEIQFRVGKIVPIPYYKIDLKNEDGKIPIESITIGPTAYKEESYKCINLLKIKEKLNVEIIQSKIPYREI